jgi:hypothetical protein
VIGAQKPKIISMRITSCLSKSNGHETRHYVLSASSATPDLSALWLSGERNCLHSSRMHTAWIQFLADSYVLGFDFSRQHNDVHYFCVLERQLQYHNMLAFHTLPMDIFITRYTREVLPFSDVLYYFPGQDIPCIR